MSSMIMSSVVLVLVLLGLLAGVQSQSLDITDSRGYITGGLSLPLGSNNEFACETPGAWTSDTFSFDVEQPVTSVSFSTVSGGSCNFPTITGDGTFTAPCTPSSPTGTFSFAITYRYTSGGSAFTDQVTIIFNPSPTDVRCPSTVGDPQFRGFRGQSYQIHGMDGVHYNLITSELTQINAKFDFLDAGKCPIINGVPAVNCWSHPGSYMGALGIQRIVDGVNQQLMIEAGDAEQGFASIVFNKAQVKLGESSKIGSFFFNYTGSHSIIVETGNFTLIVDNSDGFVNQAVKVNIPLSQLTSHGLLGQTHSMKIYPTQFKYIEADVDDYAVSGLFENDFVFNQFSA